MMSGDNKRNFFLLSRLLLDVGSDALRQVLDSIHPPASFPAALTSSLAVLQNLKQRRILNASQWHKLFPSPGVYGASNDFDITLLVVLLRNICNLPLPSNRSWDRLPLSSAITVSDDIARIKYYRNKIYGHVEDIAITDQDFNIYWPEIADAIIRLGGKQWQTTVAKARRDALTKAESDYVKELKDWVLQEQMVKDEIGHLSHKMDDIQEGTKLLRNKTDSIHDVIDAHAAAIKMDLSQTQEQIRELTAMVQAVEVKEEEDSSKVDGPPSWWRKLSTMLKELYLRNYSEFQPLPWLQDTRYMEQMYTAVDIVNQDDRKHKLNDMKDVFRSPGDNRSGLRVRLEGNPGVGKSLYCYKVAHDWARGDLTEFDLLFLVECRYMQDALPAAIFDQIIPDDFAQVLGEPSMTKSDLWDVILHFQEKVIFIIDGYDELDRNQPNAAHSDLSKLLAHRIFGESVVVVTSRPDECKELKALRAHYRIRGFSEDNKGVFINKHFHFGADLAVRLKDDLAKHGHIKEISENPLNLLLICLIWEDNESIPNTVTELYWAVILYIIKRYCERNEISMEEEDIPPDVLPQFANLSNVAFAGVKENRFSFPLKGTQERFSDTRFLKLGFTRKEGMLSKGKFIRLDKQVFTFAHASFQEALCAWFVSHNSICDVDFFQNIQSKMMDSMSSKLLCKFLAGFMKEGAEPLFEAFGRSVRDHFRHRMEKSNRPRPSPSSDEIDTTNLDEKEKYDLLSIFFPLTALTGIYECINEGKCGHLYFVALRELLPFLGAEKTIFLTTYMTPDGLLGLKTLLEWYDSCGGGDSKLHVYFLIALNLCFIYRDRAVAYGNEMTKLRFWGNLISNLTVAIDFTSIGQYLPMVSVDTPNFWEEIRKDVQSVFSCFRLVSKVVIKEHCFQGMTTFKGQAYYDPLWQQLWKDILEGVGSLPVMGELHVYDVGDPHKMVSLGSVGLMNALCHDNLPSVDWFGEVMANAPLLRRVALSVAYAPVAEVIRRMREIDTLERVCIVVPSLKVKENNHVLRLTRMLRDNNLGETPDDTEDLRRFVHEELAIFSKMKRQLDGLWRELQRYLLITCNLSVLAFTIDTTEMTNAGLASLSLDPTPVNSVLKALAANKVLEVVELEGWELFAGGDYSEFFNALALIFRENPSIHIFSYTLTAIEKERVASNTLAAAKGVLTALASNTVLNEVTLNEWGALFSEDINAFTQGLITVLTQNKTIKRLSISSSAVDGQDVLYHEQTVTQLLFALLSNQTLEHLCVGPFTISPPLFNNPIFQQVIQRLNDRFPLVRFLCPS